MSERKNRTAPRIDEQTEEQQPTKNAAGTSPDNVVDEQSRTGDDTGNARNVTD